MDFMSIFYNFIMNGIDTPFSAMTSTEKFENLEIQPILKEESRSIIECKLENPQFVLYENILNIKKSNSLIFNQKNIFLKLDTFNQKQNLDFGFIDIIVKLKTFKTDISRKPIKYLIMSPTSVFFNSTENIDQENQSKFYKITLTEINITMTQLVVNSSLELIKSILKSLNESNLIAERVEQSKEQRERDEGRLVKFESLFKPILFDRNDFWFTKNKNKEVVNNETSAQSLMPKNIQNEKIKTELKIKASKINFQLEADQIPLIRLIVAIKEGILSNWLNEPSLNLSISLEMAYFNQVKVAWEPIIEQIETINDTLRPYELYIDMVTNDGLAQEQNNEINANNFPIRSFNISSTDNLQFVVTRTFYNLIDTIVNNYTILNGDKKALAEEKYNNASKLEENNLKEMIVKDKNNDTDDENCKNVPESDSDDDDELNVDNPSFKILIKNELGFDVNLETISGFKFLRMNLIAKNKNIIPFTDRVLLKSDQYCPISFTGFIDTQLNEEIELQRRLIKLNLNVKKMHLKYQKNQDLRPPPKK